MKTALVSLLAFLLAGCSYSQPTTPDPSSSSEPLSVAPNVQVMPKVTESLSPPSATVASAWPLDSAVWLSIRSGLASTYRFVAFPLACLETPTSCDEKSVQIGSPIAAENMDGPAPAPDGSSVLFSADYNGLLRLRPTGAIEPLTPAGVRAFAPALSPDGRNVLYQVSVTGSNYELWSLSLVSGEASRLAEGVNGKWSPDSSAILYRTLGPGQLMWLSTQDGETKAVTPGMESVGSFAWSPDGRQVAFSRNDGKRINLYVIELAGGGPRQLAPELPGVGQVAWSPDGKRLAFTNNATNTTPPEVYIINVDGSGLTNLTNTPLEADEFPGWLDNSQIAFIRNSRDLWAVKLDDQTSFALTRLPDMEQVAAFVVTAGQRP